MLRLKRILIDTPRENVGYLWRDCLLSRTEKFQGLAKIEVASDGGSGCRGRAGRRRAPAIRPIMITGDYPITAKHLWHRRLQA